MKNQLSILGEAKRICEMGGAVHWLRPMSKAPVEMAWSENKKDTWEVLKKKHQTGYGVGVKLGAPSFVKNDNGYNTDGGYLAVIDVDIKGKNERYKREAYRWIEQNLGKYFLKTHPITISGRGGGSIHIWLRTPEPMQSKKLVSSSEEIEVLMPSAKPTKKQIEILGQDKVDAGWRLRPAWEVDFMSEGKQVVLPPTIHPDSGKAYSWATGRELSSDVPLVETIEKLIGKIGSAGQARKGKNTALKDMKIELEEVSLFDLADSIGEDKMAMLEDGTDVEDRSAACFTIAIAMVLGGYTDAQICWVLTNRDFYLGNVAYEHAQTEWRERAAKWVVRYCIEKAREGFDGSNVYAEDNEENTTADGGEEAAEANKEMLEEKAKAHWKDGLDRNDKDMVRPTMKNVMTILANTFGEKCFVYDEFALRLAWNVDALGIKKGSNYIDAHSRIIKSFFAHRWHVEPTVNTIDDAVEVLARKNTFHPVRDYLNGLQWDGVKRIETWLKDYAEATTEGSEVYLAEVSKKFLVAAVARIFDPGVKFDNMLILEGKQGVGKSTLGAILASKEWFLDSLPHLQDKDATQGLQGRWFVEFGELVGMKKAEVETMKAFVSRDTDRFRPSYGKHMIVAPRQCIFFGTTNEASYLQDKTGNRRFWPVEVGDVDLVRLREDRDQLFAEALWCYQNEEVQLWLSGQAREEAEGVQSKRVTYTVFDVIEEKINTWLEKVGKMAEENYAEIELRFSIKQLFDGHDSIVEIGNEGDGVFNPLADMKADNYNFQLVSAVLKKLGFVMRRNKGQRIFTKVVAGCGDTPD